MRYINMDIVNRQMVAALVLVVSVIAIATGCSTHAGPATIEEAHEAYVMHRGSGMIYLDRVDCKRVMQEGEASGVFHCYKLGFVDSLVTAKPKDKSDEKAGKYFQYDMQRDWVAISGGDTLRPVFFEPVLRHELHRTEGILVFESLNGKAPDTLIYTDSFGSWGTQQFIITSSKK